MPFEIVRNDIVHMQVDAIVNTASHLVRVGYGVDHAVHKKAGPQLLQARSKIGELQIGDAAITPGYNLDARYVIHAVSPVWQNGDYEERALLRKCYDRVLQLAAENHCESIAFPLLSAGNHGFPKDIAIQTAISAFSEFLMEHDMQIYLVVFGKDAFRLSGKLFHSVASYIDENYIVRQTLEEYGVTNKRDVREEELEQIIRSQNRERRINRLSTPTARSIWADIEEDGFCEPDDLGELLKKTDAGFSETLLKLIERSGKKDPEIYKKANVDKKLFSKIKNNPAYKPSKSTAIAFAIALELDLEETKDLIGRAGFALSHSSEFDIIIEYFITHKNYNMFEINETLFDFDQSLLGV